MATRNLTVERDARIKQSFSGGTNAGAGNSYYLDVGPIHASVDYKGRILIRFSLDFSGVTSITSAKLKMKVTPGYYESRGGAPHVRISRCTSAWSEGTYPSDHGASFSTTNAVVWGDVSVTATGRAWANLSSLGTGDWTTIDITDIVTAWKNGSANYGIEIAAANINHDALDESDFNRVIEFYASESSSDPYILLTYTTNVAPTVTIDSPGSWDVIESGQAWNSPDAGPPVYATVPKVRLKVTPTDPGDTVTFAQVYYSTDGVNYADAWWNFVSWASGVQQTIDLASPLGSRGGTVWFKVLVSDSAGANGWSTARPVIINDVAYPTITAPDDGQNARLVYAAGSGWSRPRFQVDWAYSDPNADAQAKYKVYLYADSGGSIGAELTNTGWVTASTPQCVFDYSGLTEGTYYWLKVETQDARGLASGLQAGATGAVRVRARWAVGQYVVNLGAAPSAWSVAPSTTLPANSAVVLEYGSNSSASAPSEYSSDLGPLTLAQYLHYRVWLFAWGSSPTSPTLDSLTVSWTSGAGGIVPDHWSALPTNSTIDESTYAYGRQSLRFVGDAGSTARSVRQGKASDGHTPIVLLANTAYVLSSKFRTTGAPNLRVRVVEAASGTVVFESVAAADQSWDAPSVGSAVYENGDAAKQVYVEAYFVGTAAQSGNVDAIKLEASKVVTPWAPGYAGRGVSFDAGGLQIDAVNGGVFRLRSSAGYITDLGPNGLVAEGSISTVDLFAEYVQVVGDVISGDDVYLSDGLRWSNDTGATMHAEIDSPSTGTLRANDGAGGSIQFNVIGNADISGAIATQGITHLFSMLNADLVGNPSAFADTGLSCTVSNGREYAWEAWGVHAEANVSTGVSLGFNHPGGSCSSYTEIYPGGAATNTVTEFNAATDTNGGTSTNTGANADRFWRMKGTYQCTADGTFSIRYKRNGTSANVTLGKGSILIMRSIA